MKREESHPPLKLSGIQSRNLFDYALFMGPSIVIFTVLFLIPLISEFFYTFTDWNGIDRTFSLVGFRNYLRTFEDKRYITSFIFTINFSVCVVVFSNFIAFFWAYILSKDIPFRNFWRALIYVPRIIGGVVLGFLWRFIFQNVFVQFGNWSGLSWFSQKWFTTPESSFWALVIVMTWTLSGYLMIIYGAGFSAIPGSFYEAASIDGATKWHVLRKVSIPMLWPSITRCLFIAINWAMLLYDTNLSLTNGNPYRTSEAVTMNIYISAFRSNQMAFGAAKAIVFVAVLIIISFMQIKLTSRKEVEL
jgi:raffinose/stachyose/melibiose transport system permease protein